MEVTSRRLVSIRPVPFDDGESNRTRRMNTAEASAACEASAAGNASAACEASAAGKASAASEASAADEELDMEDWSTRATVE